MKRKIILLCIAVMLAGVYVFKTNQNNSEFKLWEEHYYAKKERRLNKVPSNKALRIGEVQDYFNSIRRPIGSDEDGYPVNYIMEEYQKLRTAHLKSTYTSVVWTKRGPNNIGGRTRSIVLDPRDKSNLTWYAGSATGGAWKTTDGGKTWKCLTDDLPYQSTTTLALSKSNPDVIYMGTGESFDGSIYTTGGGIFKSVDAGLNWEQLPFTAGNIDFRFVNRLVVSPHSAEIILAATTKGIYKSKDGGENWQEVYTGGNVEQIISDTSDFKHLYASVKYKGVMASVDTGSTWNYANKGIQNRVRTELALSPVDPRILFASVSKVNESSELYYSNDRAQTWQKLKSDNEYDYLGQQGMYDNTIACHPYDKNQVFWGGVNLWKAAVASSFESVGAGLTDFYGVNTDGFLEFVNFSGEFPGIEIGSNEGAIGLSENDFTDIEIRFGPDKKQFAHRFFVPEGATSGVSADQYTYQDYIEVPFEVWDVTNNKQLMCSFRDQERDGKFNLYPRTGQEYGELGREYLFIHALDYSETPNADVVSQGRSYKLNYFFWIELSDDMEWNEDSLPESKLVVSTSILYEREATISNVSDAYDEYGGKNSYGSSIGLGKQIVPGLHPDHHGLLTIPIDDITKSFWVLNSNDGGLSISTDNGENFTQISNNYLTTQFYSVAKKPGKDEYIGGMQDNGTWQSEPDKPADSLSKYYFRLGGDGFDVVWNNKFPNKILASLYNNRIYLSTDGGKQWEYASEGLNPKESPFVTKMSNSPKNPDVVFAVGTPGVYVTKYFGKLGWKTVSMPDGWLGPEDKVTSSHHIEVSKANYQVVWAGAAMNEELNYKLFLSKDAGESFSPVGFPDIDMPYFISGIASHPLNKKEAFVLYSGYKTPKILRTYDFGATWTDISGFNSEDTSSNGFPDVACFSLLVFPDDTNKIWVGTEIGIIESTNNGEDWHLLEGNMPTVTVYSLIYQDKQVVAATFGKGIWTCGESASGVQRVPAESTTYDWRFYPNPARSHFNLDLSNFPTENIYSIGVYDLKGKLIKDIRSFQKGLTAVNLEPELFPPGNYFVAINLKNRKTLTEMLVVCD